MQPGIHGRITPELTVCLERLHERFLHEILRLRGIAAEQVGGPEQPIAVILKPRTQLVSRRAGFTVCLGHMS
jgi:hypothetical protein